MKIAVFSSKSYEKPFLDAANVGADGRPPHERVYLDARLSASTVDLARGCCASPSRTLPSTAGWASTCTAKPRVSSARVRSAR